jgi:hypothetical protein
MPLGSGTRRRTTSRARLSGVDRRRRRRIRSAAAASDLPTRLLAPQEEMEPGLACRGALPTAPPPLPRWLTRHSLSPCFKVPNFAQHYKSATLVDTYIHICMCVCIHISRGLYRVRELVPCVKRPDRPPMVFSLPRLVAYQ